MSKAAQSIYYFGIYVVAAGAALILAPAFATSLFGLNAPADNWVRFAGMIAIAVGIYYIVSGRNELKPIFRASLYARSGVFVAVIVFALLGWFKWGIVLIGLADILGVAWTYRALRQDEQLPVSK